MDKELGNFKSLINNLIGKEELLAAVEKIVKNLDKKHDDHKPEILKLFEKALAAFKERNAADFESHKTTATTADTERATKSETRLNTAISQLETRVAQLKDGESPEVAAIVEALIPYIPPPIPGTPGSPDTSEDIRDKLELLEGDERLEIEAIKNLREELDALKKRIKGFSGSFGAGGIRVQQTILAPAEAVDDTTTTFTFAQKPLIVVVNGVSYREGHGWAWVNEKVVLDFVVGSQGDLYAIV